MAELQAAHEVEQCALEESVAVNRELRDASRPLEAHLTAMVAAARRRRSAAKGILTKARKCGDSAEIAAALKRRDAAESELAAISDAVNAQMAEIAVARLASAVQLREQMVRAWHAESAFTAACPSRRDPIPGLFES